jgi:hypothetical protein
MRRRTTALALLVTGALAPVTVASGAGAQNLPPIITTTTTTAPTTTTSTTAAPATTTTTEAEEPVTTTTSTTTSTTLATGSTTTTTVAVQGGGLSISVPEAAALPTAPTGTASLSGALGTVTVTDDRGGLVGAWTVSVATTPFTTGGGSEAETISPANVRYWSGPATSGSGGTFSPGQPDAGSAVALDESRRAFSTLAASGRSTASWTPTLIVDVPATAVVGTYAGTVTHSVA